MDAFFCIQTFLDPGPGFLDSGVYQKNYRYGIQ